MTAIAAASVIYKKNQPVYLRGRSNPVIRTVYTDGRKFWIGAPEGGEDASYVIKQFVNAGTKMRTMHWKVA